MLPRLSSQQIFTILTREIFNSQDRLTGISKQLSSGKKIVNSYDDPTGMIRSIQLKSNIAVNNQNLENYNLAISELDLAESSIAKMQDITNKVRELTVQSGSDSISSKERADIKFEIRALGEALIQLGNTKLGSKHIFSGKQSNVPAINHVANADFNTGVYKNNLTDLGERKISEQQTSVSIFNAFMPTATSASVTGTALNPTTTAAGTIDLTVNDGTDNIVNFSVNLTPAMNLAATIAAINTAYNAAGGAGNIAQENPVGYLNLDTALSTGNMASSTATIEVLGSSNATLLTDLGLSVAQTQGQSGGLLASLSNLENRLSANDSGAIRNLLADLDANLDSLNNVRSKVGTLINGIEILQDNSADLNVKLNKDLSNIEDIDFAKASSDFASAQAALTSATQTAASLFSRNLFNFLGG